MQDYFSCILGRGLVRLKPRFDVSLAVNIKLIWNGFGMVGFTVYMASRGFIRGCS